MDKTQTTQEPGPELSQWVERLSDRKAERREAAQRAIDQLGPDAAAALMRLLEDESRQRKRRARMVVIGAVLYVLLMLGLALTGNGDHVATFTCLSSFLGAAAASQKQKNAAKALAGFEDPAAAGFLAEALDYGDKDLRAIAMSKLTALMPRLQATDSERLLPEQRAVLYKQLRRAPFANTPFTLAILKGLEQVGDEKAVPAVRELSERRVKRASEQRVVDAARECLPYVEQQAERSRNASRLLRPSCAPDAAAGVLLRPVDGTPQGDPNLLLRAAEEPDVQNANVTRSSEQAEEAHVQA